MANRCFSDINKDITSASDHTSARKSRTIYKSIERNYVHGFGGNPMKKNGYRYQQNFYFADCSGNVVAGGGLEPSGGIMLAANSYEHLLHIAKGSYYANPTLQSAQAAKYSMWGGNCTEVNYSRGGTYKTPNTYFAFSNNGDASNLSISGDFIRYPYGCVNDCSYTGQYPGYIVDASNVIFYEKCFGRDSIDKAAPWIASVADVSFRWTSYYWRASNAQPLQGFSYPKTVRMWRVPPNPSPYTPLPPPSCSGGLGDCSLNTLWCSGNYAIN